MTRTEKLYNLVKEHRAEFLEKQEELDNKEKHLEPLRGSQKYDEAMKKIRSERVNLVKQLREKYGSQVDIILAIINKNVKENGAPMEPPTEEALRTLQLLKMRQEESPGKLYNTEFESAIPVMGGNATALKLLQDLALKSNVTLLIKPEAKLTSEDFQRAVEGIAQGLQIIFNLPRLNNKAAYGQALYNGIEYADINAQIRNTDGLKYDNSYNSTDEFLSNMTFLQGDALNQFKAIADKE